MPYTPPSSRSPASSTATSPDVSRRSSFHQSPSSAFRPVLPRSASYLTRERRTAPAAEPRPISEPTPESTSEDLKAMVMSPSVRQSPPPITGDRKMPNGAIISPPDSSSDDDDLPEVRQTRGRTLDNLKELKEAISHIPQNRSVSPTKESSTRGPQDARDSLAVPSQASAVEGMHHSLSTGSFDELAAGSSRRFSHARSKTETDLLHVKSVETSLTGSEEDSDEEIQRKPQMVRKKSGELVRPALRPPSRRRPSSMPGTPTFSKAVHFDSHLEHVRHFLQVDRPLAVSAGSSPVDNYDSDTEYPFSSDERSATRSPQFEWEIVMNNFPLETPARKAYPVRLERVSLSNDQKCLIGSIAVANLAFQKTVTCRFTLDYWKTTSEVAAEYVCEVQPAERPVSRDRFQFTIKLSDLANLESKTLYFCIRYSVNGQEFWDNNGGMNFQADFRKKMLPQNGKKGVIGAASRPVNGLPKSTRRGNPSTAPRPRSMPVGMDEFSDNPKLNFDQSVHAYLGESAPETIRLKSSRSASSIPSDNLPSRLSPPSGQAFAYRYDFGPALTAAIQNAKDQQLSDKSDGLYMKSSRKPLPPDGSVKPSAPSPTQARSVAKTSNVAPVKSTAVPGTDSPSSSISSASHDEIVQKFCFFGSKQSLNQLNGADNVSWSTNSSATASYEGSPVQMGNYHHNHNGTQHHSLHPRDPSPYFHVAATFVPIGASPAESPLNSFSPPSIGSPMKGASSPTPSTTFESAGRSSSPASSAGGFPRFGTSSNDYSYQHMQDRFPFSGTDAHAATAIRG